MAQRLSNSDRTTTVTSEQLQQLTTDILVERLPLGVRGYRYTDDDIYNVVVAAAAQQRSINSVCQQLELAPSANLVRHYLTHRLFTEKSIDDLEDACNTLLIDRLPPHFIGKVHRVAIDLTLLPYYGRTIVEPGQLRRGEAKAGTTHFHCYATAFVLHAGRRITLAVTFVYADEAIADILADLLGRLSRLGARIKELYLDREFASVACLQLLTTQPFTSIVALPKRGKALKALGKRCRSQQTTYTMMSDDGSLTFPLWIACRNRRDGSGREALLFAVVGQRPCTIPIQHLAQAYRARFGIEARYRQMHQAKAHTTSADPSLRLLFVTIALLLTNLWVWLKAILVAHAARADRAMVRAWLDTAFRLDRFRDLLIEALKARYRTRTALVCPFALAGPLKL